MRAPAQQTCSHLRRDYFEQLGEPLWCARCDANVRADGSLVETEEPPFKRNLGARFERALTQRLPFHKR